MPTQTNPSNGLPPGTAGIRKAIPVNLPLVVGKTSPTALAAPVALGIMLQDAARPPRQSCVGANDLENKETGALYGAQELHITARTPIMWKLVLGEYIYIYILQVCFNLCSSYSGMCWLHKVTTSHRSPLSRNTSSWLSTERLEVPRHPCTT